MRMPKCRIRAQNHSSRSTPVKTQPPSSGASPSVVPAPRRPLPIRNKCWEKCPFGWARGLERRAEAISNGPRLAGGVPFNKNPRQACPPCVSGIRNAPFRGGTASASAAVCRRPRVAAHRCRVSVQARQSMCTRSASCTKCTSHIVPQQPHASSNASDRRSVSKYCQDTKSLASKT